jgi:AAA domain
VTWLPMQEGRVLPFESNKLVVLAEADEVLAEDDRRSSWARLDLREHLGPSDGRDAPSLLLRADGQALFYEQKRNEIHGAYESGKSWIALLVAHEVIRACGVVCWLDFEDSPRSIAGRLLALGATEEQIITFLRYVQPSEPLTPAAKIDLRLELHDSDLVVIDAANEAMAAAGLDPNANRDVAAWYAEVPKLATEAHATLLVLDHVAKRPDQQRGAVGAGHKQAAIDGASYRVDGVKPFGRGSEGLVRLRLTKDRPGYIRGALGTGREPAAADIAIDATDPEALSIEVRAPGTEQPFRPTGLMEKVSLYVESRTEPATQRQILDAVRGKRVYTITAIEQLVTDGHLVTDDGPRGAILYTSSKPFREAQS